MIRPFYIFPVLISWFALALALDAPPLPIEKPRTQPVPLLKPHSEAISTVHDTSASVDVVTPKFKPSVTLVARSSALPRPRAKPPTTPDTIESFCEKISAKLHSVTYRQCKNIDFALSHHRSVNQVPLVSARFSATVPTPNARVLLVGGTHGDEYTSISVIFKWLTHLTYQSHRDYDWLVAPLLNPDGLLRSKSTRTNANGVDLNRNLPTPNWQQESHDYWVKRTSKNPRRYPGTEALSEPENQWLVSLIEQFAPDVIVATHAPHGIVDFDGPPHGPKTLGSLGQQLLGTFPGSLGNYAGLGLGIPVVTIEFDSAVSMPSDKEIEHMWIDLHAWLSVRFPDDYRAAKQLRADASYVRAR